jgi:hypothetical protein
MLLSLEVVDVALGSNQLILSVLQSGADVVKVISLEITAAISLHQLIIQLPGARLQVDVFLQKLSVALLDVLDDAVFGLHLTDALLQMEAHVSARHCDLLKQGVHVLGVACGKRPTRMVGQKLGAPMAATCSLHTVLPSFQTGSKAMMVSPRTGRWFSQNSVRAWWAALSRVSLRSSPRAVVNKAVMVGLVG